MNEIAGVAGQIGVAAGKLEGIAGAFENQIVAIINRLHDRFQLVKAIGPFAQDIQEQVDFAG